MILHRFRLYINCTSLLTYLPGRVCMQPTQVRVTFIAACERMYVLYDLCQMLALYTA